MSPQAGRPLRVLHVNPSVGWRGGEAQTLLLCKGLAARGHEILLAAAPGDTLARRARDEGIPVDEVSIRGDGDLPGIIGLGRTIARFRPHLVHLHTARAHAAGWAVSFAFPRVPMVAARRVDFVPARDPLTRLKYTTRIARFIAVSDRVADVLAAYGVERRRIRRVYSGVPPRARPADGLLERLRGALGIVPGERLVGTVGALAEHKDPIALVKAFPLLLGMGVRAQLLFVGDGPLRGAIETEASRLGLTDRVRITGFRDDPIACLSLLDVFVAPSHLEGLNTSLLDAMSLGTPIVAARAGGMPELIGDDEAGLLVPPRDPAALARAIAELLTDDELAGRVSRRAHARASLFSDARMVDETEAIYREILNRPEHGAEAEP